MQVSQALDVISKVAPKNIQTLAELLPLELVEQALKQTDTVTFRKRKLTLESMVWLVIGMAIYNDKPLSQIVNMLDIVNRDKCAFVAPSAVVQRRQDLGSNAIEKLFDLTQEFWNKEAEHPCWNGLTLLAIDGVVWRTEDTPENNIVYTKPKNTQYPLVRMVCQMELSSHLITASVLDDYKVSEMRLAEKLVDKTADNSLTLFDRGFYSLGLLHKWQTTGKERHWLIPLKKGTQYEVIRKLGKQDVIVRLKTTPQAKKKWVGLPAFIEARLVSRKIKGKVQQVLTSMTDAMRYPIADIADLYSHRWEIELGYREKKQYMLGNRLTLRSRRPDMVQQELWGILLSYNLVRYQMVQMTKKMEGDYLPYQLSFNASIGHILRLLVGLPYSSPGAIPGQLKYFYELAPSLVLPPRRERKYPRAVKPRPQKYAKNKAGLR